MDDSRRSRLAALPIGVRVGLSMLVLVFLGGFVASAAHLYLHHSKKDERPGLSLDDLKGAYHGVRTRAPLVLALERGHPETLAGEDRAALLSWLSSDRLDARYDDPDLGERAPAELIAANCLECHSRRSVDRHAIARTVPLDYWDDVRRLAFGRELNPVPVPILVISTHTHALSLAAVSVAVLGLLWLTGWSRGLTSAVTCVAGVGLAADIGGWWLARLDAEFVWAIIAGGGAYTAAMVVALLLVLADLARPTRGA